MKTGRGVAGSSNNKSGDDASEFNADDNASTISNASTNMSYQNDLDSSNAAVCLHSHLKFTNYLIFY